MINTGALFSFCITLRFAMLGYPMVNTYSQYNTQVDNFVSNPHSAHLANFHQLTNFAPRLLSNPASCLTFLTSIQFDLSVFFDIVISIWFAIFFARFQLSMVRRYSQNLLVSTSLPIQIELGVGEILEHLNCLR